MSGKTFGKVMTFGVPMWNSLLVSEVNTVKKEDVPICLQRRITENSAQKALGSTLEYMVVGLKMIDPQTSNKGAGIWMGLKRCYNEGAYRALTSPDKPISVSPNTSFVATLSYSEKGQYRSMFEFSSIWLGLMEASRKGVSTQKAQAAKGQQLDLIDQNAQKGKTGASVVAAQSPKKKKPLPLAIRRELKTRRNTLSMSTQPGAELLELRFSTAQLLGHIGGDTGITLRKNTLGGHQFDMFKDLVCRFMQSQTLGGNMIVQDWESIPQCISNDRIDRSFLADPKIAKAMEASTEDIPF